MIFGGLFVVILVVLFLAALITRRRFGVLGLALAAGALLSSVWTTELVRILENTTPELASIPTTGLVSAGLVVAPALLLLFSGPSYKTMRTRVVGSVLFAIFAALLVVEPLSNVFELSEIGSSALNFFVEYKPYIVTTGIVLALLDLLAIHTISGGHRGHKEHK